MHEDVVIDRLIASSEALIAAFDAHDIEAIETALPAFGSSVDAMKTPGAWQQAPGLFAPSLFTKVEKALALADTARTRVLCLADHNRQRIDLLAAAAGRFDATPATYGRQGR